MDEVACPLPMSWVCQFSFLVFWLGVITGQSKVQCEQVFGLLALCGLLLDKQMAFEENLLLQSH